VDLNNYYTSPNKLFDFIQARLPMVASDLPFLRKVIAGEGLGLVAHLDSPQSYAEAINKVLGEPDKAATIRANLRRAAPHYTWAAQAAKLVEGYGGLVISG
jgi:glycosyltransferase involved in cell wall biosynthesis